MKPILAVLGLIALFIATGCAEPIPDGIPHYQKGEIVGSTVDPDLKGIVAFVNCYHRRPCIYEIKWRTPNGKRAFDYASYIHEYELRKLSTQRW